MIDICVNDIYGINAAILGMRNPLKSWDRSDTKDNIIGKNDYALAKKLILAGSEHRKFLRQIYVSLNITAPEYWWKEYATYKIGTTENSTSTMHTITKSNFTFDMFSFDENDTYNESLLFRLNTLRQIYISTKDKNIWRKIIQTLPMSYNYTRTCTLNYETLTNIYNQRKAHKLVEWVEFCNFIEKNLSYSEFITHKFLDVV